MENKSPVSASLLLIKALHFVEIPIKDLESNVKGATTTMRVPMVLPHELLCYLVAADLGLVFFPTAHLVCT